MLNYPKKTSTDPNFFEGIKNRLKAYVNYLALIFAIFLIFSLLRNINNSRDSLNTIENKKKAIAELELKNQKLKESLEKVRSDAFIEKQIRDQLGLSKSGEIVLVLPEDDVLRKLVPEIPKEEEEFPDPIWKKWLKLFL